MSQGVAPIRDSALSIAASLSAAFGGMLFGYDVGIISGALLQLKNEFQLSCFVEEMVVSSILCGAVVSSLFGGPVIDRIGSKHTMMINCLIFMMGAALLATAVNVKILLFGRIFIGLAVGLSVIAECIYIAEISSPIHRGKLVSLTEVAIALGFLLAFLVNFLFIHLSYGWRIMFGLSGVLALIQCLLLLPMPKSPRFLLMKKRKKEAFSTLLKLRQCPAAAKRELSEIEQHLLITKDVGWSDVCSFKNSISYRLILGFGLVLFQQFSGQPSVLYYAPQVLEHFGFSSSHSATLVTVGAGGVKVVGVIISLTLIDRLGRRKLLLSGCVGMCIALISVGVVSKEMKTSQSFTCKTEGINATHNDNTTATTSQPPAPSYKWISLLSMMLYVGSYSLGYGPVTWVVISELYPTAVKGRASALVSAVNWLANILVSFTFLHYVAAVGISLTFVTYAVSCVAAFTFVLIFIPETKGKALEDINSLVNDVYKKRNCCPALSCPVFKNRQTQGYERLAVDIALQPYNSHA